MTAEEAKPMDFDAWMAIAERDPEGFEDMRRAAIDAVIEKAAPASRARLRRLQWRIDQERRLAPTPMSACVRLSSMMWRNVLGPGGLQERLEELQRLLRGQERRQAPPRRFAKLIAFARPGE